MAIFSRRTLQRIISENKISVGEQNVLKQVDKLNQGYVSSLSTEWELVVLNALAKQGHVEQEKSFEGRRKPDIFFRASESDIEFVADVTCISDKGLEDENGLERFYEAFANYAKKMGLDILSGFYFRFQGEFEGEKDKQKMKLKLPPPNLTHRFIRENFQDFLRSIREHPDQQHRKHIDHDGVEIIVEYWPERQFVGHSGPNYKSIYSLTNNPVFNRLKSKADQLKGSGYRGTKGLVVCDGDCTLLSRPTTKYSIDYGVGDVIREFFRNNSIFDFVVIVYLKDELPERGSNGGPTINYRIFINDTLSASTSKSLEEIFDTAFSTIPEPMNNAVNARFRLEENGYFPGESFDRAGSISEIENEIKFSSRKLMELLAGRITQEQFEEDHSFVLSGFERRLNSGQTIQSVKVIPNDDKDDDWVLFHFNSKDAAISRYE